MTDDKLSFLDEKPAARIEEKPQAIVEPIQEVKPDVSHETLVEKAAEPAKIEPVVEPKGDGHSVPLPKYLDVYNENRDLKRRISEFEAEKTAKAEMPDPILDPEGYHASQQRIIDDKIWDARVIQSEIAAKRFYGADVVKAAFEAVQAQNDPLLGMRIRRSADPWEEIVKWHKRELLLAEVGEDPKAYRERIIAEHLAAQPPAGEIKPPVQVIPAKPAIPAASLTRAPAGAKPSDVPVGPGQAFDAIFAR